MDIIIQVINADSRGPTNNQGFPGLSTAFLPSSKGGKDSRKGRAGNRSQVPMGLASSIGMNQGSVASEVMKGNVSRSFVTNLASAVTSSHPSRSARAT
jgi:hypothetical protein